MRFWIFVLYSLPENTFGIITVDANSSSDQSVFEWTKKACMCLNCYLRILYAYLSSFLNCIVVQLLFTYEHEVGLSVLPSMLCPPSPDGFQLFFNGLWKNVRHQLSIMLCPSFALSILCFIL